MSNYSDRPKRWNYLISTTNPHVVLPLVYLADLDRIRQYDTAGFSGHFRLFNQLGERLSYRPSQNVIKGLVRSLVLKKVPFPAGQYASNPAGVRLALTPWGVACLNEYDAAQEDPEATGSVALFVSFLSGQYV